MKRVSLLVVAVVIGLLAPAAPPASAAPHKIYASSVAVGTAEVFQLALRCDPSFLSSPANGVEARVFDVGFRPFFSVIDTSWSATLVGPGGRLTSRYLGPDCAFVPGGAATESSLVPGPWRLHLPAGTRWVIVTNSTNVDVTLNL